jgi:hypothetical protein
MGSDRSEGCAQVSGEMPGRILVFNASRHCPIDSRAWLDTRTRETEGYSVRFKGGNPSAGECSFSRWTLDAKRARTGEDPSLTRLQGPVGGTPRCRHRVACLLQRLATRWR